MPLHFCCKFCFIFTETICQTRRRSCPSQRAGPWEGDFQGSQPNSRRRRARRWGERGWRCCRGGCSPGGVPSWRSVLGCLPKRPFGKFGAGRLSGPGPSGVLSVGASHPDGASRGGGGCGRSLAAARGHLKWTWMPFGRASPMDQPGFICPPGRPGGAGVVGGEGGSVFGGATQPWVLGGGGIAPLGNLLGAEASQGPSRGCVPRAAPAPCGRGESPPLPSSLLPAPSSSSSCPSTIFLHFKKRRKPWNAAFPSPRGVALPGRGVSAG